MNNKLKIEFTLGDFDDFDLGISSKIAEDENGLHQLIVLGFLLFNIEFSYYYE